LDEAQCLPLDMTMTIVDLLNELAVRYSATIVLSTATQPAFKERERFPGLRNVHEIIAAPSALADRLRRVQIRWPATVAQTHTSRSRRRLPTMYVDWRLPKSIGT
jgi:CRISPR-associated endonuclease/helicase Cas3